MSQKVQHIPPSGHLSTASLALLMAGQSLTTQYLSGVDIRGLVLADIAASLLLVLVCGTRFLRIVSLLQGLLSLFCLSYAASMGMPPTLAAILNGSRQIAGMDLRSLWTYIDPAALVALSLLVAIQCWLCGRKPRLPSPLVGDHPGLRSAGNAVQCLPAPAAATLHAGIHLGRRPLPVRTSGTSFPQIPGLSGYFFDGTGLRYCFYPPVCPCPNLLLRLD